jgi:hypothetical protein
MSHGSPLMRTQAKFGSVVRAADGSPCGFPTKHTRRRGVAARPSRHRNASSKNLSSAL